MKSVRVKIYTILLLIPFGVFATLFWILALLVDPVAGDLTRIGGWTENDFGWNAQQPVIKIVANDRAIVDPDMVVLGDSFSITNNYWQSVLTLKLDKKILSFGIDDVGCIDNWVRWAKDVSTARVVLIEVVERNFIRRFRLLSSCEESSPIPIEMLSGITSPSRPTWPPTMDARYLFRTAINSARLIASPRSSIRSDNTVNAPIRRACARFSNRRSDRLLYYMGDDRKKRWTDDEIKRAVANVRMLQNEFSRAGKRFIFVLVPDKSTVYQDCLIKHDAVKLPNVTSQLILAGVHMPDLLTIFRADSDSVVDLYLPDNTHLSESGYLLMAARVEKFMGR